MTGELLVDPLLILDVLENDARFGVSSAALIDKYESGGLVISPIAYLALAPAFAGDRVLQDEFLGKLGVTVKCVFSERNLPLFHRRWASCVEDAADRGGESPSFLTFLNGVGAFSFAGLLTRRGALYRALFPNLNVITE